MRFGLNEWSNDKWSNDDIDAPWHPVHLTGLLEPAEFHQAVGMISEQLAVTPHDAIVRLRGTAALVDQPVLLLARSVIARQVFLS